MKHHRGFGVLEIFIAIGLGALLLVNVIMVFIAFQHHSKLQADFAEIQERGRFATYFLTTKIHQAGDASCLRGQWVNQAKAIGGDVLQLGECLLYQNRLQFVQTQYYIADTGRKNTQGQPIFSLFMKTLGSEREELIEGVKTMRVRYGVSLPGQHAISAYLAANQITNWQLVRSVDITLVLMPSNKAWPIYAALRER